MKKIKGYEHRVKDAYRDETVAGLFCKITGFAPMIITVKRQYMKIHGRKQSMY